MFKTINQCKNTVYRVSWISPKNSVCKFGFYYEVGVKKKLLSLKSC